MKESFAKLVESAASHTKSAFTFFRKLPVKLFIKPAGKLFSLALAHPIITFVIVALIIGGIAGGIYWGNNGNKLSILPSTETTPVDSETLPEEPIPEIDWAEVKQLTIVIEDNKVYMNDNNMEFKDAEELRSFLEKTYNDEKIVRLDDSQSILATRDWVIAVLDDLGINYAQPAT